MKHKKKKATSALYMPHYGISTVVVTENEKFELYMEDYKQDQIETWPELKKHWFVGEMKKRLVNEDAYFNLFPDQANGSNQRWLNFCEDCIELAALDCYLLGNPIRLLHPESFEKAEISNSDEYSSIVKPTLMQGVPIVRMDH